MKTVVCRRLAARKRSFCPHAVKFLHGRANNLLPFLTLKRRNGQKSGGSDKPPLFQLDSLALIGSAQERHDLTAIRRECRLGHTVRDAVFDGPSNSLGIAATLFAFIPAAAAMDIKRRATPLSDSSSCWRYLSFRAVSSQVLSAEASLTSVFGMGTGGPSP